MDTRLLMAWFGIISCILVLVGIVYCFFGLSILPVDTNTIIPWASAIYGAIMIGWGTSLLLMGRLAFRRDDAELMKIMLYGIVIWLVVEASFSAYLGVLFNVGVDIAVLALFSIPLILGIRHLKSKKTPDMAKP